MTPPPDLREKKYDHWQRLARANADYRKAHDHSDHQAELEGFLAWMQAQWGIDLDTGILGYTAYYRVVDHNKHLLFQIRYG